MTDMKRLTYKILFVMIALAMVSCKRDDTLRYGNVTMGNFVDGTFVSDQGNLFNITENLSGVKTEEIERGIMQCDVLSKVEGTENAYNVRVTVLQSVFTKNPIAKAEADADAEKTVEDPIHVQQYWIAGGYLNMYVTFEIQFPYLEESKHMLNLAYEKTEQGYTVNLRHNAFGECLSQNDSAEQWMLAGSYVSFPLSSIITENEAKVLLKWKSHVINGQAWSADVTDCSVSLQYSKDYFEQAPQPLQSKSISIE